jgi:molybdopterin synthase sulfur carrier subunit
MAVNVLVPTALYNLTGGKDAVEAQAGNVTELVQALEDGYPGLGNRLRNADGGLNRFINIYVNGEDIRFLQSGETALKDGDEVSIVPAIAGGKN